MQKFELTPEQYTTYLKWRATKPISKAADGAQFEFRFLITGVGIVVKVFDHVSQDSLDLTDYESW